MYIHTLPFTNLLVAFWMLSLLITWFGLSVAFAGMKLPAWFRMLTHVIWISQTILNPIKIVYQVNGLANIGQGLWWDIHDENIAPAMQVIDSLVTFVNVVLPMIQSGYLAMQGHKTHCVTLRIEDNRPYNE